MWVLLVYLNLAKAPVMEPQVVMQEFESQQTCQAAGSRMWELSGRRINWSCMKK